MAAQMQRNPRRAPFFSGLKKDTAAFKSYIYHPLRVFIFWATENLGLLPMVKDLSSQHMIKKSTG